MNHYEKEKLEFEENFKRLKNQRIILYGIGRFTATLTSLLHDWNIVGLMDKDPDKIGTYVYGLPIIGLEEAESKADAIIINTSGSYWNLIYQRIKTINVPIYFRNGEKAESVSFQEEIEYWHSSYEQLRSLIDMYEIISFDFFDSLFLRKLYMVNEIWEYVGDSYKNELMKNEFLESRKGVYTSIDKNEPNINDIYENLLVDFSVIDKQTLMYKEIDLESSFTEPRYRILSLIKYALKKGKEVYIISDMYLPTDFFDQKLKEYSINLPHRNIWISCERGCSKRNGELWHKFQKNIVKNKKALHIGDDRKSDITCCRQHSKMDAYFVMSKDEMLRRSSIKNCLQYLKNGFHNIIFGLCISKLFNDPFALCKTQGKVQITDRKKFGYCVFGPVIFSFIYWMLKQLEEDAVDCLCFLGRDGFFLKQDFEYLYNIFRRPKSKKTVYLETSRQILMCASINNESDFTEYIKMPYEGKMIEFFEDRLLLEMIHEDKELYAEMNVSMPQDYEKTKEIIYKYRKKIAEYIDETKKNYKKYLEGFNLGDHTAVVDLGFYGTTQHYLSKLLKREFVGYYIVADSSEGNLLSKKHVIKTCTKITSDESCNNSYIHSMGLAIESFLTSPHGMVRSVKDNGQFIYAANTNNQVFIKDKLEINEGIQLFIKDIIKFHRNRLDRLSIYIDDFIDNWYGEIIKNTDFSESIKRSFYNDNAFIHRRQERIFGD